MELAAARNIIDTLAQGIHPVSGEVMPEDSPYNAPPIIRALFAVSQALDSQVAPPAPRGTEVEEPPPEVRKRIVEVTILYDAADESRMEQLSLEDIGREMDTGALVGVMRVVVDHEVPPDELRHELVRVGNDGTFFDN